MGTLGDRGEGKRGLGSIDVSFEVSGRGSINCVQFFSKSKLTLFFLFGSEVGNSLRQLLFDAVSSI